MNTHHKNFWHKLIKASNTFDEPVLIENFVLDANLSSDELFKTLDRLSLDQSTDSREKIRVYKDSARKKYLWEKETLDPRPGSYSSIDSWLESKYGDSPFFIFINHAGTWSENLSRVFASFVSELNTIFPVPYLSYELHIAIGRYKSTPFGFHLDEPNDRVIHFNVGRNTKTMYLINREKFPEITGSTEASFEIDYLKSHSKQYLLPPNSLFLLPSKYYHVGESENVSLSIILAITRVSQAAYNKNIFTSLSHRVGDMCGLANQPGYSFESTISFFRDFTNDHLNLDAEDVCEIEEEYKLRCQSNSGFVDYPTPIANIDSGLPDNAVIMRCQPFPITYCKRKGKLRVFIRGRSITLPFKKKITDTIDLINSNAKISVKYIVKNFANEVPFEFVYELIGVLKSFRGITIEV